MTNLKFRSEYRPKAVDQGQDGSVERDAPSAPPVVEVAEVLPVMEQLRRPLQWAERTALRDHLARRFGKFILTSFLRRR